MDIPRMGEFATPICGMLLAIFTSFCTSMVGSILIFGSTIGGAFGGTIC